MAALVPQEPEAAPRRTWVWPALLVGSVLALIAVLSFAGGIIAEREFFSAGALRGPDSDNPAPVDAAFPRQAEVRSLLESEYFFVPASPEAQATFWAETDQAAMQGMAIAAATPVATLAEYQQQLDYGAAQGMMASMPDAYTVFLEPLEGAPLREELAGEYEGIGVWVEHPEGRFTIVSPIAGSPADRAGLRPGDVIVAADGTELEGLENDAAMSLIRGPAGTSVTLTIAREGSEPFDVEVSREAITIPAVVYETVADGAIAHITVAIFGDNTTQELDAALKRAKEDGVSGIVLDLRGNGGGWVTSAQEMIGRFVPADAGPALYQDAHLNQDDDLEAEPIEGGGEETFDTPLVVLTDGGTASAAEIVSGAIRDYDRGTLVGEPTFGKGLVQRVHDFDDGSSARITFARWLTPNQTPIPDDGIKPDIVVPFVPDIERDLQLDTAIALLKGEPLPAIPAATPVAPPMATPLP
ncbi:MAG: S41 family peptidase [Thermomicrobiales bacterium]|nr:S41 family peptidase [Thermomicrobiales bacterium]